MSKVIISGVCGQSGSYMAEYLISQGHEVYGLVRNGDFVSSHKLKHIRRILSNERFMLRVFDLKAPVENYQALIDDVKPYYILNFAANSNPRASIENAQEYWDINTNSVLKWLTVIQENPWRKARFFSAGSSMEFQGSRGDTITIDTKPCPLSIYGASKAAARTLCQAFRQSHAYAVHGICFNMESSRRGDDFLTPKVCRWVNYARGMLNRGGRPESLKLGSATSARDWSHASDSVKMIWASMNLSAPNDYLFCSGETRMVKNLVDTALRLSGIEPYDVEQYIRYGEADFSEMTPNFQAVSNLPSKITAMREYNFERTILEILEGVK